MKKINTFTPKILAGILAAIFSIPVNLLFPATTPLTLAQDITPTVSLSPAPQNSVAAASPTTTQTVSNENSAILPSVNPSIDPAISPDPFVSPLPSPTLPPLSPSPTPLPIPENTALILTPAVFPSLIPSGSASSAQLKQTMKFLPLNKKSFKLDESINFKLINSGNNVSLSLKHSDGQTQPVIIKKEIEPSAGESNISLKPLISFKPGKYTLIATDDYSDQSVEEFYWGMLNISPDKSVYKPGETALFNITVLDELGKIICTSDLTLEIISPEGNKSILSTSDKSIIRNPSCRSLDIGNKPDYSAVYNLPSETGEYQLILKSVIKTGIFTVNSSLKVEKDPDFIIERISPARIFPSETYQQIIKVTANRDFEGIIKEKVPSLFDISPAVENGLIPYNSVVSEKENLPSNEELIGAPLSVLRQPFNGQFPISLGFNETPDLLWLRWEYLKSGFMGHDGVDFAMPEKTPILAVDDGIVFHVGYGPYGKTIIINHSWGKTYYGHLSEFNINIGQNVKKGDLIALSGSTGLSTGPHLHFVVRPDSVSNENGFGGAVDPLAYLNIIMPDGTVPRDLNASIAGSQTVIPSALSIIWKASLKKGETKSYAYKYRSGISAPQSFVLGPVEFYNLSGSSAPDSEMSFDQEIPGLSFNTVNTVSTPSPAQQNTIGDSSPVNPLSFNQLVFQDNSAFIVTADSETLIDNNIYPEIDGAQNSSNNIVFTSDEIGYIFFTDNSGFCVYSKTTDSGESWSIPLSLNSKDAVKLCRNLTLWYDRWTKGDDKGTKIHLLYTSSPMQNTYYQFLNTSDDSLSELMLVKENFITSPTLPSPTFVPATPTISPAPDLTAVPVASPSSDPFDITPDLKSAPSFQPSPTAQPGETQNISIPKDNPRLTLAKSTDGTLIAGLSDGSNNTIFKCNGNCTPSSSWTETDRSLAENQFGPLLLYPDSNNLPSIEKSQTYDNFISAAYTKENKIYSASVSGSAINTFVFDGTGWTAKTPLNFDNLAVENIRLSVDQTTGKIFLVYSAAEKPEGKPATDSLFYVESSDGMSTWTGTRQISSITGSIKNILINPLSDGRIYAAWHLSAGSDGLYGITIYSGDDKENLLRHGKTLVENHDL